MIKTAIVHQEGNIGDGEKKERTESVKKKFWARDKNRERDRGGDGKGRQ